MFAAPFRRTSNLLSPGLFLLVPILIVLFPVAGATADLVIISSDADQIRHSVLQESIDAQLMDYNASSELYLAQPPFPTDEGALSTVRRLAAETGSKAVLWLGETRFYLYVTEGEESHLFTRLLPENTGSWEVQCDAIASIVQAMLSPWLASTSMETPAVSAETNLQPPVKSTDSTDINRRPDNYKQNDAPRTRTRTARHRRLRVSRSEISTNVRPGIGAAFATCLMSTENMWASGADGTLTLQLGKYFLVSTESGFLLDTTQSFRMLRIPVRLRTEILWKITSFSIGFGASFILDVTRVSSTDHSKINNHGQVYFGVGGSISFMYEVNPIFSIVARGGVDVYQAADNYWFQDDLIFYYGELQGRTSIGIIFWLR